MISAETLKQFRKENLDGRRNAHQTAGSSGSDDPAAGTDFQIAGRAVESLSPEGGRDDQNRRVVDPDQRGTETKSGGERQRAGRPRQNNRSAGPGDQASSEQTTILGNLEAVGPRVSRLEKPSATFSKEEPKAQQKKKTTGKFTAFSDKEAEEMGASLPGVLMGHFEDIDEYLWNRQKQKFGKSDEQPVWSDLDEEDCVVIATAWIKVGRKNRYVAEAARVTVDSSAYIKTAILVTPRFRQTAQILRETYIPRKSRLARANPD